MTGDAYYTIREIIERSVYAEGMVSHLNELSPGALQKYIDEFFTQFIKSTQTEPETLAGDFIGMTTDVLRRQHQRDVGNQKNEPFSQHLYQDRNFMERKYLNGLTLALVFWPNHWRMFRYFEESVLPLPLPETGRFLDLGCGHGLFSARFMSRYPEWQGISIDISTYALERTENLLQQFNLPPDNIIQADVIPFLEDDGPDADVILFSEILEHLEVPEKALKLLARRLARNGIIFLTTATNSFFYDHRTYFDSLEEILNLIRASGLEILDMVTEKVKDTPTGPQTDVFCLLVHRNSVWKQKNLAGWSSRLGLHHIGYLSQDMSRSLEYWSRRESELIFGPVVDLSIDCRVAFVKTGTVPCLVELVEPYSPDSLVARRIGANRLDHLCYQVPDLESAIREYVTLGARLTFGPVTAAAFHRRVAFLIDREGLLTELVESNLSRPWFV